MRKIEYREVLKIHKAAELDKISRGKAKKITPLNRSSWLVSRWWEATYPTKELGKLHLLIDKDHHGSYRIHQEIGSYTIADVMDNLDYLRKLNDPQITEWLSSIDGGLRTILVENHYYPGITTTRTLMSHGNVFNGNHRLCAAYLAGKENVLDQVKIIIGEIPIVPWYTYNMYFFATAYKIPLEDRREILIARLNSRSMRDEILENADILPRARQIV
jgi:hypothetical protein